MTLALNETTHRHEHAAADGERGGAGIAAVIAIAAIAVQFALVTAYAWTAASTAPRNLPVAITGPQPAVAQVTGQIEDARPGAFKLISVAGTAQAEADIRDRVTYGAITLGSAGRAEVLIASGASPAVANVLTELASRLDGAPARPANVRDIVPVASADTTGAGFAFTVLPLMIGSLLAGVLLSLHVRCTRYRALGLAGFGIGGGATLAGVSHTWLGIVPGRFATLWVVLGRSRPRAHPHRPGRARLTRYPQLAPTLRLGFFSPSTPESTQVLTVRKNIAIIVLLAAGTALRVMAQLAYRPALIYIDTPKYLITSDGSEPEGYRVFVRPLEQIGGLGLVTVTQHLMGLAVGVALYVLLVRRGAPGWAAALAAAPVLLDSYQLVLEENVMPDVMFETLLTAGIVLLAWRARPPWWLIAAGALTMGAAVDVREIGLVLIVPLVLFVALIAGGWRMVPGRVALASAAFGVPVLGYMSMAYGMGGHFALVSSPQPLTYGRAAYAADCATLKVPRLERRLCPSPVVVSSLNQGIDSLLHSPRWSPLAHLNRRAQREKPVLTHYFAREVIRQQPLRVAASVARDAVRLFALTRDGSTRITDIDRFQFQTTYPFYPPATTARLDMRMAHGSPVVVMPLARLLRDYQLDGGYTPGPMLAACLVVAVLALLGAALASRPWGRRRWRADPELAAACLLATLAGAGTLLASDFYEFSWRYQLPAFVTLPLAGLLGVLTLAKLAPRRHRHHIQIADQRDRAPELLGGLG